MPLTLEQYAGQYLPGRPLPWPAAPPIDPPKAKPHLARLPVKAVMWTAYGTLVAVPGGEIRFEDERDFVMEAALDKTIQEFKMWAAMSRKPGAPAAQMRDIYTRSLTAIRLVGSGGERYPELSSERVWDDIVRKLDQREYTFDAALYGSRAELIQKIAYFFHASIQGCGAYPHAAEALRCVADAGKVQGLLADGQCFTYAQLHRSLGEQESGFDPALYLPADLRIISAERKAKKPSPTLFQAAVDALKKRGIAPNEVLHVGSNLARDLAPAKKAGMRVALFAGDRNSLSATPEQLKAPEFRPDAMLTDLRQIADVVG